jgi:OTU domain-containing protein 3
MLWLALFNNAEHYQSVRRKGDHERGPAEIDDKLAIPHEADQSEAAKIARGEVPPALTKAIKNAQGHSALVAQVLVSLPPHHGHSPEYVAGILARVKGNVGEAVEILLEEIVSDDEHERNSDQHVEALLVDSEESRRHRSESPAPALSAATTSSPSAPNEPTSPSGSTTTTQSDSSRISKITTPSTTSSASASGSRSGERKPYDRPRKEELAEELDELRVNAGTGSASRGGTDAPARRRGRPRKDEADARRDALRQLRESRQRRQSKT